MNVFEVEEDTHYGMLLLFVAAFGMDVPSNTDVLGTLGVTNF
jgi:hypothetical protein